MTRTISNTLYGVISTVLHGGGRFLILLLLAKFYPPAELGQFVLAWAIITPLSYLVNLELRLVLAADVVDRYSPHNALALRSVGGALLVLIAAVLYLTQVSAWGQPRCLLILLIAAVRALEGIGDIFFALCQKNERMSVITASQALRMMPLLLWLLIVKRCSWPITAVPLGWIAILIVVIITHDRPRAARLQPIHLSWNRDCLVRLVRAGIPLGLFMTFVHLNDSVPRFFLAHRQADDAVAYFGALAAVVTGLVLIQTGINQSLMPRLARRFTEQPRRFVRLLIQLLLTAVAVVAALVAIVHVAGPTLLTILFRSSYADYAPEFTALIAVAAAILVAMILGDALIACHRFRARMVVVALGLLANILVCHLTLTPDAGLYPVIYAALTGALVTAVASAVALALALHRRRTDAHTPTAS